MAACRPTATSSCRIVEVAVSSPRSTLELSLPLDPQVARELGFVAAHVLDKVFRVLAADERLELDAERKSGERASSTTTYTSTARCCQVGRGFGSATGSATGWAHPGTRGTPDPQR
jgi:hypothetical protein